MKANIIQIGKVVDGNPMDWSFDSYTNIPALNPSGKGILYYGYTAKELEDIAQTQGGKTISTTVSDVKTAIKVKKASKNYTIYKNYPIR